MGFYETDLTILNERCDMERLVSNDPLLALDKMYVDEIKYFIDCIDNMRANMSSALEGERALKIALAAKLFANRRALVHLT